MAVDNRGNAQQKVTIAQGQSESTAIDCRGMSLTGLIFPTAPSGTSFTFKGSIDGANYYPLHDADNTAVAVAVSAARIYMLNPTLFLGLTFVKLVSNASESALRDVWALTGDYTAE